MKKLFISAFSVVTLVSSFVYFACCLTPYISPLSFWPMAFLALGFPYLAPVILFLALCWLFIRRKVALLLLVLFFAGFQNIVASFAIHPKPKSTGKKDPAALRILTWNVRGFDNPSAEYDTPNSVRRQMFDYISKVDPDVLCLQEFAEHYVKGCLSNTAELKKRGYIYIYKTNENVRNHSYGTVVSGSAIFSKLAISDTGKVMLGDPSNPEHICFANVFLENRPVRIFSTHFKSINLFAVPEDTSSKIAFYGDSDFVYHSSKFEKLKAFAQAHTREAFIAKNVILKSPHAAILGTDMNSVPASYQYHYMAKGLQDAFKQKGWGLGTTMADLPKTLRIDFLFVDKKLTIAEFYKDEVHLSDHFPQFIDVRWKNN